MSDYKLNKEQLEAVEYTDGPLLIVAGAGTGKTSVITKKITHLIESGLAKPEEILALTFTDKAAQEMQDRVDEMLPHGYMDLQISTFHGFCQRLLERYGLDVGIPNQFNLFTQTESWLLIKEHLYDFELDYYRPLGNPSKHIHGFISHFSKCKDELISPEEYISYAENFESDTDDIAEVERSRLLELANAYHTYNQLLLKKQALDFGDLIFYTAKLLKEKKNVQKAIQDRYKYILVDEFQDVNYGQYELVRLMAENSQLTVVGDDDQSIYAFRGASVSNIMRFKDDYSNAKEIVLTENYRSGQNILDASYKLVQNNNPDRLEVKLKIDKKLKASGSAQGKIEHIHSGTLEDEAKSVTDKIAELHKRGVSLDEIAILVRANSHAEPFMESLESAKISYEFLSASGLYRQPVVIDAFNIFKVLAYNNDSQALYRLLRIPSAQISERDMQTITAFAKKKSLPYIEVLRQISTLHVQDSTMQFVTKLISTITELAKKDRFEKPTNLLYFFLETIGYLAYLTKEEEQGNKKVIVQIYQLRQFFEFLESYQRAVPHAHAAHFVNYFTEILESGDEGKLYQPIDTPSSVNIMTVHGSKGLEFDYVFMVNMVDDRFPSRRRGESISIPEDLIKEQLPEGDSHIQEERRLCYVGMTRARKHLFFTSGTHYGGVRKKKISRFLHELGYSVENKEEIIESSIPTKTEAVDEGEIIYPLPKAFSYSQIKTYQTCPYKYKLAHILKLPSRGSASFSFGSTMHAVLQKFYEEIKTLNSVTQGSLFDAPSTTAKKEGIQAPSLERLLELYEECWIADWYKTKKQREDYYSKGKQILRTFYESQVDNWNIPVALESWFKIKVGKHQIHGRIDRVDQEEDGTLEIIDYKTGKPKEKLIGEDKEQLLIYQIAATTLPEYRHIGETSKLTFHYLNDNIETSFVGNEKEIEKLKEKLSKTMDQIYERKFDPTPGKFACSFCDFKSICEYRKV